MKENSTWMNADHIRERYCKDCPIQCGGWDFPDEPECKERLARRGETYEEAITWVKTMVENVCWEVDVIWNALGWWDFYEE